MARARQAVSGYEKRGAGRVSQALKLILRKSKLFSYIAAFLYVILDELKIISLTRFLLSAKGVVFVLLPVIAVAAFLIYNSTALLMMGKTRQQQQTIVTEDRLLFPDLLQQKEQITKISFVINDNNSLSFINNLGKWMIREYSVPASTTKIDNLLDKLAGLKAVKSEKTNDAILLSISANDQNIGEAYINPGQLDINPDYQYWVNEVILNIPNSRIKKVITNYMDDNYVEIQRLTNDSDLRLLNIYGDKQLKSQILLEDVAGALDKLAFLKVRPVADFNFDDPVSALTTTYETNDGMVIIINTLRDKEGNRWSKIEATSVTNDVKIYQEVDAINIVTSGVAYQFPEDKSNLLTIKMSDLVE